jgi:hypothetical protein
LLAFDGFFSADQKKEPGNAKIKKAGVTAGLLQLTVERVQ